MNEAEKLTSKDLKKSLAAHMLWRLHFPVVVDEYDFMDIFGVRSNGYKVEFEIKLTRSDFMREINLINGEQPIKYSKDWVKWEKHANYLGRMITKTPSIYDSIPGYSNNIDNKYFIPNEFNFYVPDFLTEFALSKLTNLPYGLVQYGKMSNSYGREYFSPYEVIKKPKKLHEDKNCLAIMGKLAHALAMRNRLLN